MQRFDKVLVNFGADIANINLDVFREDICIVVPQM